MIISITKDEVDYISTLALKRWLIKFGSVDKPNYAKGKEEGKLEHELLANIRANVCEWAVAKYYNLSWNTPVYPNELHAKRANLPDIGVNGEVRSVRTQDSIPFWEKDYDKIIFGAKLLDSEYYSKVEVYGKIRPKDYASAEYYDSYIDGWRVPIEEFEL
jgi:hypothetical protein